MKLLKLADKFHTWSNSLIKDSFPTLSLYYYIRPRLYLYWRTQPVHHLLNEKSISESTKPSFIFFTVHKSASTLMVNFIEALSKNTGLVQIDYNGYFATQEEKGLQKQSDPRLINKVFKLKGYIYGPLRNYIEVPEIEKYPIILLLRDPRDVLTSQYYSIKKTHPLITRKLIARRKKALQSTIDEHVMSEQADRFFNTYTLYIDKIYGKPNVLFLKYEDMVHDFRKFILQINSHLKLNLSEEQINSLDLTKTFKTNGEDQNSHKRKVTPGDHKEKLQPETIKWLNKKFEPVLKKLNYPI